MTSDIPNIRENCRRVLDRIQEAAVKSNRDVSSIRLIAVTKTVSAERIREAVAVGITEVGENRLQEALLKKEALRNLALTWHFIGHAQTNKSKKIIENFDFVHSVDRIDLAIKINAAVSEAKRFPVLVEVNLGNEKTKSGIPEDELTRLIEEIKTCERLDVRGLMAIPPFFDDPEKSRPYFAKLRALAERFSLSELSMGMSHDFDIAVQEGATMVRVGTALFGLRK